jgi:TRAP-type C4-dicarboxylate transport system permease small subunit
VTSLFPWLTFLGGAVVVKKRLIRVFNGPMQQIAV